MTISMQDFPLPVIKHGNGKTHHPLIDDFPINTLLFQKCSTATFYYQLAYINTRITRDMLKSRLRSHKNHSGIGKQRNTTQTNVFFFWSIWYFFLNRLVDCRNIYIYIMVKLAIIWQQIRVFFPFETTQLIILLVIAYSPLNIISCVT
jgi:hypothetical protein